DWWRSLRTVFDPSPLEQQRSPGTFLCASMPIGSEMAQAFATPGFSLVTLDDLRRFRDTPNDTLDRVNLDAIIPQLRGVRELLFQACVDSSFKGLVELERFETSIKGRVVSLPPGKL